MTILRTPTFIAAVSILLSLTGCNEHVIYHSYRHVPEQGWNSRDTFTFDIDTVRTAATYQFALGLRSTDSYPYTVIWLAVEREFSASRHGEMPVDGFCHPPHGQRHLYVPIRRAASSHDVAPRTNRTSSYHTSHATGSPSGHTRRGSPHQPLKP